MHGGTVQRRNNTSQKLDGTHSTTAFLTIPAKNTILVDLTKTEVNIQQSIPSVSISAGLRSYFYWILVCIHLFGEGHLCNELKKCIVFVWKLCWGNKAVLWTMMWSRAGVDVDLVATFGVIKCEYYLGPLVDQGGVEANKVTMVYLHLVEKIRADSLSNQITLTFM